MEKKRFYLYLALFIISAIALLIGYCWYVGLAIACFSIFNTTCSYSIVLPFILFFVVYIVALIIGFILFVKKFKLNIFIALFVWFLPIIIALILVLGFVLATKVYGSSIINKAYNQIEANAPYVFLENALSKTETDQFNNVVIHIYIPFYVTKQILSGINGDTLYIGPNSINALVWTPFIQTAFETNFSDQEKCNHHRMPSYFELLDNNYSSYNDSLLYPDTTYNLHTELIFDYCVGNVSSYAKFNASLINIRKITMEELRAEKVRNT